VEAADLGQGIGMTVAGDRPDQVAAYQGEREQRGQLAHGLGGGDIDARCRQLLAESQPVRCRAVRSPLTWVSLISAWSLASASSSARVAAVLPPA
jgi:hypothetical protein